MLTHLKRFAKEDADRGSQWAAVLEATVKVRMALKQTCGVWATLPNNSAVCAKQ